MAASEAEQASRDEQLNLIVVRYLEARERGEPFDCESLAIKHPECADELLSFKRLWEGSLAAIVGPGAANSPRAPSHVGADKTPSLSDYRIRGEVGRGGMGIVYDADQLSLGRRVALKVLPAWALLDARRLQRFQNEARAAARLDHPNIVPVYAVGCEQGIHFFSMRLIEGRSLRAVIDELRLASASAAQSSSPPARAAAAATLNLHDQETMPALSSSAQLLDMHSRRYYRAAAELGVAAAEALEHAHQCGVVHRDIKPSNLLLDNQGRLWITDFGLASMQGAESLTETGELLGTLHYMSPEQAASDRSPMDARTDIYSLGMSLYELVTLRTAFAANDRRTLLRQLLHDEPTAPSRWQPRLPRDLETIIMTAIAKEPADRYPSAEALAVDLRNFLDGRPLTARRPSLSVRAARRLRRHPAIAHGIIVALALWAVVLAAGSWRLARSFDQASVATRGAKPWDESPLQLDEGQSFVVDATRIAGEDAAAAVQVRIDWGDGVAETVPANVIANHTYADGPAKHRPQVTFLDAKGVVVGRRTRDVLVSNLPPTVEVRRAAVAYVGRPYSAKLSRPHDVGRDAVESCQVDWGDGAVGQVTLPDTVIHTFDAPGKRTARVRLRDEDGDFETVAWTISVEQPMTAPPRVTAADWRLARSIAFDRGVSAFLHPQDGQLYVVRYSQENHLGKISAAESLGLFRIDSSGNAQRVFNRFSIKCAAPHPVSGDVFVHMHNREHLRLDFPTWQHVKWTGALRKGDTDICALVVTPDGYVGDVVKPLTALAIDRGVGNPKAIYSFSADVLKADRAVIHDDQGILVSPVDLAVSRTEIFVADTAGGGTNAGRIFRVLTDGELEVLPVKGQIGSPCGIAVTADNQRLFIADMDGDRILEVSWPQLEVRELLQGLAISSQKDRPYLVAGCLRLSPDEQSLVVTDHGNGFVHLLERHAEP